MDFYRYGFGFGGYGGYHPWGGAEKSRHAKRRENETTAKFDAMKSTMETAMVENTILELRTPESKSHLKAVPTVLMNTIFGFVFGKEYKGIDAKENATTTSAAVAASSATSNAGGRRSRKSVNYSELNVDDFGNDTANGKKEKKASKKSKENEIDFNDMTLYEPGNTIKVPLAMPNHHLTQPCYRDLRKHVKKNPGWDTHRVALSDAEKKAFKPKLNRKGTCYYVNAIYKVPGQRKKKRATFVAKAAPAKKKAKTVVNAKPAVITEPNPIESAVLQKAVNSALNDSNGEVDAKCLQRALAAGFSKFFVLAEAAKRKEWKEYEESKPAAKIGASKQEG